MEVRRLVEAGHGPCAASGVRRRKTHARHDVGERARHRLVRVGHAGPDEVQRHVGAELDRHEHVGRIGPVQPGLDEERPGRLRVRGTEHGAGVDVSAQPVDGVAGVADGHELSLRRAADAVDDVLHPERGSPAAHLLQEALLAVCEHAIDLHARCRQRPVLGGGGRAPGERHHEGWIDPDQLRGGEDVLHDVAADLDRLGAQVGAEHVVPGRRQEHRSGGVRVARAGGRREGFSRGVARLPMGGGAAGVRAGGQVLIAVVGCRPQTRSALGGKVGEARAVVADPGAGGHGRPPTCAGLVAAPKVGLREAGPDGRPGLALPGRLGGSLDLRDGRRTGVGVCLGRGRGVDRGGRTSREYAGDDRHRLEAREPGLQAGRPEAPHRRVEVALDGCPR